MKVTEWIKQDKFRVEIETESKALESSKKLINELNIWIYICFNSDILSMPSKNLQQKHLLVSHMKKLTTQTQKLEFSPSP